jgi:hypothetical protein
MLSQISAGSSIPLAGILLLVLPYDPSTAFKHGLVFFTMGLCTSWNAPATNKYVFLFHLKNVSFSFLFFMAFMP